MMLSLYGLLFTGCIVIIRRLGRFKRAAVLFSAAALVALLYLSERLGMMLSRYDHIADGFFICLAPGLAPLMKMVTAFGSVYLLLVIAALFVLLCIRLKALRRHAALLAVNLAAAAGLNLWLKSLIHRPRPELPRLVRVTGYSFPSGHTMVSTAFYGYLLYLCLLYLKKPKKQAAAVLLLLLIALVGVSRVCLGAHFFSDVAGGWLSGAAWLAVFISVTRIWHKGN